MSEESLIDLSPPDPVAVLSPPRPHRRNPVPPALAGTSRPGLSRPGPDPRPKVVPSSDAAGDAPVSDPAGAAPGVRIRTKPRRRTVRAKN